MKILRHLIRTGGWGEYRAPLLMIIGKPDTYGDSRYTGEERRLYRRETCLDMQAYVGGEMFFTGHLGNGVWVPRPMWVGGGDAKTLYTSTIMERRGKVARRAEEVDPESKSLYPTRASDRRGRWENQKPGVQVYRVMISFSLRGHSRIAEMSYPGYCQLW